MCIAIYKPAKTRQITDEELLSCKQNNPDGFGYSFIAYDTKKKENFVVVKKYMKYEEFLEEYRKDEAFHIETPFLIHFRMTSAGSNTLENCHPFQVNRYQSFIHNGTMFTPPIAEKKSDTFLFNEEILQKLPEKWLDNEGIRNLVDSFIGYGKVAILNANFTFEIFGEKRGNWTDGIWWSNYDYKTYRRLETPSYYGFNNHYKPPGNPLNDNLNLPAGQSKGKIIRETMYFKDGVAWTSIKYADGRTVQFPAGTNDVKQLEHNTEVIGMDDCPTDDTPERTQFECGFCGNPFPISTVSHYSWGESNYELCEDCYADIEHLVQM